MIIRKYFSGMSTIGVLALSTEKFAFLPYIVEENMVEEIKEVLDVSTTRLNIGGCSLIGSLCVANSYGLLLPKIVKDDEVELIKKFLEENNIDIQIKILDSKNTALGNLVLANDRGCIISEELKGFKKDIEDILNVDVEVGNIAELPTVGSNAVATNKGCLVHPLADDEELEWIKDVLKIDCIGRGTANKGVTSVGACVIANTKGAIVGGDTTGPELLKIEEALDLI